MHRTFGSLLTLSLILSSPGTQIGAAFAASRRSEDRGTNERSTSERTDSPAQEGGAADDLALPVADEPGIVDAAADAATPQAAPTAIVRKKIAGASHEVQQTLAGANIASGSATDAHSTGDRLDAILTASATGAKSATFSLPKPPREMTMSPASIYAERFGGDEEERELLRKAATLEGELNKVVYGQPEAAAFVAEKVGNYLETWTEREGEPVFINLAGLEGVGKGAIVAAVARHLGIEMDKVDISQYTGNDEKVPQGFARALANAASHADGNPRILFLDEIDKAFEIDQKGAEVEGGRPVIGIVDNVLNDGKVDHSSEWGAPISGNLSKVLIFGALNFRPDVYGNLQAHPDLTSIASLQAKHQHVGVRMVDIAQALGKMFRRNTVRRLLPGTVVLNPLDEEAYRKLIDAEIDKALKRLLPDENGKAISVKKDGISPAFKDFLFREAVLPSTGAGYTVEKVGKVIESAYQHLLFNLQAPLAYKPIDLSLDYDRSKGQIILRAEPAAAKRKSAKAAASAIAPLVVRYAPELEFEVVPIAPAAKISEHRLLTTTRIFGQALAHARYGIPFEVMHVGWLSDEFKGGVIGGGAGAHTARHMYAELLTMLASRAMERIVFSDDPKNEGESYTQLSGESNNDIYAATELIMKMIARRGLDPAFGPIMRFMRVTCQEVMTQPIPEKMYERAMDLMHKLENFLVSDMMKAHSKDWYKSKIVAVARAGRLLEEDFYEIIDYPHHGSWHYVHDPHRAEVFGDVIRLESPVEAAPASDTRTTPQQNLDNALKALASRAKSKKQR